MISMEVLHKIYSQNLLKARGRFDKFVTVEKKLVRKLTFSYKRL